MLDFVFLFWYSYCDFSHLYRILSELMSFSDFKAYGQLVSRVAGIFSGPAYTLIPCIKKGVTGEDGYDFYDVGSCSGKLFTQVMDAAF